MGTLLHLWSNYETILGILIVFPIIYLLRIVKNKEVRVHLNFYNKSCKQYQLRDNTAKTQKQNFQA
jgi:hypothetical protein